MVEVLEAMEATNSLQLCLDIRITPCHKCSEHLFKISADIILPILKAALYVEYYFDLQSNQGILDMIHMLEFQDTLNPTLHTCVRTRRHFGRCERTSDHIRKKN